MRRIGFHTFVYAIWFIAGHEFSPRLRAQCGEVAFQGRVNGVYDSPVFVCAGGTLERASGSRYLVQLYVGPSESSLAPIGAAVPFRTGNAAGYWTSASRRIPLEVYPAEGPPFFQVRAWDTQSGATFEAAFTSGTGFGVSNIIRVNPDCAPGPPSTLYGLQSFIIGPAECPEPATWTLLLLGCVGFLFSKNKQRAV